MSQNQVVVEFITLLADEDYEILNQYPYTIRRKSDHYCVKEGSNNGYPCVYINGKQYKKHRLIAEQFIPNPNNLPFIDHINHDRTDYHILNLRWVSASDNNKNRSSNNGVEYRYVDTIPDESLVVDFYDTRNGRRFFENYYYHDGVFYYDTDVNFKILNINRNKSGCKYVNAIDVNGKKTAICINRFLEQHDLA